jgi:hypothetical protein
MKDYYQRKLGKYKEKYIQLLLKQQLAGKDSIIDSRDNKGDGYELEQEKEDQLNETITTFMAVPPLS